MVAAKPSVFLLMIVNELSLIKSNLQRVIPRSALNYFVTQLHEQIKYLVEYVIYWQYHQMGKNNEVGEGSERRRTGEAE